MNQAEEINKRLAEALEQEFRIHARDGDYDFGVTQGLRLAIRKLAEGARVVSSLTKTGWVEDTFNQAYSALLIDIQPIDQRVGKDELVTCIGDLMADTLKIPFSLPLMKKLKALADRIEREGLKP